MKKHTLKAPALTAALLITAGCGGGRQTADTTTAVQDDEEAAITKALETTKSPADVIFTEAEVKEIDENQPTGTVKLLIY